MNQTENEYRKIQAIIAAARDPLKDLAEYYTYERRRINRNWYTITCMLSVAFLTIIILITI